ncbi:unnamed protein product [Rotaria sp. Silwood1]|nr:unnamed protein product [Rotaria sp. Silwood1]
MRHKQLLMLCSNHQITSQIELKSHQTTENVYIYDQATRFVQQFTKVKQFVGLPLNRPLPMSTCEHVERDNAQCSVIVQIDFKKRFVSGQLNIGNNATIATLRTETKFQLQSSSVMATVWYTCAMLDYCDFEFLNELMIDNLANLNAISVQQKLIDLLYESTSGPTDIPCTDGLCPSNSFCQADLENTVTSQYNYTFITSTLPCYYMSPNGNLLEIIQLSSHSAAQIAIMTLRCNNKECHNRKTVTDAYALIHNEFTLLLNYSILNINTTLTTTTTTTSLPSDASFLVLSHSLIIFNSYVFIFYLFFK